MANSLVIVESPAKAKTINKFLGKGFTVKASMGHVRDLPKRTLGVDESDFTPTYTVLADKKKTLAELKKAAASAKDIYLASDPDREGEAICWHLQKVLEGQTEARFHRVMFNEITKRAIEEAFAHPSRIDGNKVDAQQARRILDRLMGYKLSPLLWEKVRRGLSAGRVQSVALRIICEREREILAFVPREYWSLAARLTADEPPAFAAKLVAREGKKIDLTSREETVAVLAQLGWRVVDSPPPPPGEPLVLKVEPAAAQPTPLVVARVEAKEKKKNPLPPFTTSKLQQDAARQLGFAVSRTMRLAQRLYEGVELGAAGTVGLITYMRTDSTRVSDEALAAVRGYIGRTYGAQALPAKPRTFRAAERAQEAHEAIRPTSTDYPPQAVQEHLGRDEFRLYSLIWNRFVASQMEAAVFDTTRADIAAGPYTFRATGSVVKSPGWLAVYHESRDEDAAQARAEKGEDDDLDDEERRLPPLKEGQQLAPTDLLPRQHFTQPPPRFSEATLVKELEENGIGRPSTYATILSVIQDRDYVEKEAKRFHPTELGLLVNDLMVASFGDIVEVGYTARMEQQLDRIEEGDLDWIDALREFQKKFEIDLAEAREKMPDIKREAIPTDQVCDKCGKPMVLKWGRFGRFMACSGYPECKNTREINGTGGDDAAEDRAARDGAAARIKPEPSPLEAAADPCAKCGKPMVLRRGRFGQFLACSGYPECKSTRKITVAKDGTAEAKADVLLDETCPRCRSRMARKHGRFGEFVACSNYPDCRYVKVNETDVTCPQCGKAKIVERRSRRGKTFYGCAAYPDCDFVLWRRPVNKPCPQCDQPFLVERTTKRHGAQLICESESCDHVESAEAAEAVKT
jgi:DNA topoisomerase-1